VTRTALLPALFALFALGLAPTALANAPAWGLQALAAPTHFVPGDESGVARYEVFLINSGAAATDQNPITITDTLPKGLVVKDIKLETSRRPLIDLGNEACGKTEPPGGAAIVTCVIDESLPPAAGEPAHLLPSEQGRLVIFVAIPASIPEGALLNQVAIEGGGAEPAAAEAENSASAEENTAAGFQEFQAELTDVDGHAVTSAASHPYQYTTSFAVNLNPAPPGADLPFVPAGGDLKGVEVELPPGLIANPRAVGRCSAQQFNTLRGGSPPKGGTITQNECPDDSAVGLAVVEQLEGKGEVAFRVPIYNLDPPPGMPAQLGFQPTIGVPIYIDTAVRSGGPKGLTVHAFVHNVTEAKRVTAGLFTIWGTPADESHDPLRGQCGQEPPKSCPSGLATETPLWRLPTQCQNPLTTTMSFETWAQPSTAASASVVDPAPSGCAVPDFSPAIESKPTTNLADSPSGLHFNLHLPQSQDPKVLGEADLREATVTLPPGLVVNPASADGLGACSPAQIGLKSAPGAAPIEFDEAPAACPPASKVAKVAVTTPLLDHPVEGAAYVATQLDNPFKSLIALYFALEDPETGVIIKLAGEVNPDPVTGQLTTTVPEGPQAPFEDFTFDFLSGARAPLRTPPSCGAHTTSSLMTPWSAPQHAAASPHDDFQLSGGPSGPCPSGALAPKLSAGLANPTAGTYSPFYLRLTRPDGSGEFAGLTAKPPLGLTAKLAGVPYCPQAGIDQAASRSAPGQGALEAAQPSCPAASQIGTTTAGAGAGPTPFYTGGKVYLAGPYKGAPLSLVAIIPALAGPFDLGVVVNRTALQVNSETAQVTAEPDPLPRILFGIPLDLRDVRVDLNRPNFTLAPSSCEPKSVDATVFAPSGASANVSDRFQLGGCEGLGFKPGLSLKLKGGTKRGAHPALKAVVTYPKGAYANVARASVALPHSEFLEQAHIRTICTRVQFAADACPKGSIYGKAKATTPLLDAPLEGPVYLRSSSNPLPDLVIALHGQLDVDLVGRIDSHNGGIRTTFDTVPDAPVTKFTLEMPAGKKGLLVNSRNICNYTNRATAKLTAHNGKIYDFRPVLKDSCKKQGGGKKNKHGH
jgi:hypothetical protein